MNHSAFSKFHIVIIGVLMGSGCVQSSSKYTPLAEAVIMDPPAIARDASEQELERFFAPPPKTKGCQLPTYFTDYEAALERQTKRKITSAPPPCKCYEEVWEEEPCPIVEDLVKVPMVQLEERIISCHGESSLDTIPSRERAFDISDVQKTPVFPGGQDSLMAFLTSHLKFPPVALENQIQGIAVVSFVVDTSGTILNLQLLKEPGGGCGKEALRLVSIMPDWVPGEINDQRVRVHYALPIRFRLQ